MASKLEKVERDLLRRAKEEGAAFARTQNQRLQEELDALAKETAAKKAVVGQDSNRAVLAQSEAAAATMNEAAMKEALARVQIRERLANLGHKGGGLFTDGIKGAAQTRALRQTQTREAQDAAINEINTKMQALYRDLEAAFTQKADALKRTTAQKIADKQTSLEAAAKKQAKQIARSAKGYAQWQAGLY